RRVRGHGDQPAARHRARAGEARAGGRLLRQAQALPERGLLLGPDLRGARDARRDVPRPVRDPAHERVDRAVARDDRGPGAEDRAPAPDLHGRPHARLRADRPAVAAGPDRSAKGPVSCRFREDPRRGGPHLDVMRRGARRTGQAQLWSADDGAVAHALRILFADMAPARREAVLHALEGAGRTAHAEAVAGADGLSAALLRRGWDAVLHSGDGPAPLPARRAMTLVRLADPRLPFIVVASELRAGDLSALIRGFGPDMVLAPDVAALPGVLDAQLAAARDERSGAGRAQQLLLAQKAIAQLVAAGPEPDELGEQVLATLGPVLGWSYGAVWRADGGADGATLRCDAT